MNTCLLLLTILTWTPPDALKTLDTRAYSIQYPDNWSLDTTGTSGTKFFLFEPVTEGMIFRSNINLVIEDLTGKGVDLKKYAEVSTGQIKTMITSASVVHSETTNGRHELVFTGIQGQYKLKWRQYYWVKNSKAYVLTFTATQDGFDQVSKTAAPMMESFKIK